MEQTSARKLMRNFKEEPRRFSPSRHAPVFEPENASRTDTSEQPVTSFFPPSAARNSKQELDIYPFADYSISPAMKKALSSYFSETVPAPTSVQALSLQHFVGSAKIPLNRKPGQESSAQHVLLGAETGSGKTLAYLLPLLHFLKKTDTGPSTSVGGTSEEDAIIPRALILSPTHELTRQITATAKAFTHDVKLRVKGLSSTAGGLWDMKKNGQVGGVDLLVGTGRSILKGLERGEISKDKIEWVVVDEADVLLGTDFAEETSAIIKAIEGSDENKESPSIILSTATIPPSLVAYLKLHFPEMRKLLSPALHRLPTNLKTRFIPWSGSGNKLADVAHEVKRVFAADAQNAALDPASGDAEKSKVLIFANTPNKVRDVERVLVAKGITCHAITGEADERKHGSNGMLDAFLNDRPNPKTRSPRVLITTSLLSRGLDFSPAVKHVFLLDTPRDVLDFVHRAGRTGRAGREGDVTIFGKGDKGKFLMGGASATRSNLSQWQTSTKLGQELQQVIGKKSFA